MTIITKVAIYKIVIKHLFSRLVRLLGEMLMTSIGYILVGAAFVAFLVINEGIVVGDKEAHTASFHPTQVLYFCAFSAAFSFPFALTKIRKFLGFAWRHIIFTVISTALMTLTVHKFTLAHKYLLADNRHYTFYLWRRLITPTEWAKYLGVPVYVFGAFCVLNALKRTNVVFKLTFPIFVVLNLTPQLLLEFRYFIIPYLIYRLQVRPVSWWQLVLENLLYLSVNFATIYLFIDKPFRWDHEPEDLQRFIW